MNITMIVATISILIIAGTAWALRKVSALKICPACAGVAGTWLWMFLGVFFNQLSLADYQLSISILVGGSVIGIAHQIEKRFYLGRFLVFWKILFIAAGFIGAYSLISFWWMVFIGAVFFMIAITLFFQQRSSSQHSKGKTRIIQKLLKKMEKCC